MVSQAMNRGTRQRFCLLARGQAIHTIQIRSTNILTKNAGEFFGGADIVMEAAQNGQLKEALEVAALE